jgi:hypothetical protein
VPKAVDRATQSLRTLAVDVSNDNMKTPVLTRLPIRMITQPRDSDGEAAEAERYE